MRQPQPRRDACFRHNHVLATVVVFAFSFVIVLELCLLAFYPARHFGARYTELAAGILALVVLGQAYRSVPCKAERVVIACGGFVILVEVVEPYLPYKSPTIAGALLIVSSLTPHFRFESEELSL
jgi:hypothetical protein